MNKLIPCFAILLALTWTSCKKKDGGSGIVDSNPTSYRLKSVTSSGGQSFGIVYNSDNLVSTIGKTSTGSLNGQSYSFTDYASYDYTNGLCTKVTSHCEGCSQEGNYLTYEYDSRNLPVKKSSYYANGSLFWGSVLFEYDGDGKLIESYDSSGSSVERNAYTYNSDGNLTSITNYVLKSGSTIPPYIAPCKVKREWTAFDDRVNFLKTLNGLPLNDPAGLPAFLKLPPNNYMEEKYYRTPIPIDELFRSYQPTSYSYEYNDEGLPVKMYSNGLTTTFVYEKYK